MTGKPRTRDPGSLAGQRARTLPGQRVVNLLARGLLRTPGLARIAGSRLVTLYIVGRNPGRRYCVPVAYMVNGNDTLIGTFAWMRTKPSHRRSRGRYRPVS
jgi:hypothetical protein